MVVKIPVGVDEGLPVFGDGPRGDLCLRIGVRVPEHLTHQERNLYEKLRAVGAHKVETP